MQSFMMGVIMGLPPAKDKELREHQKSQTELRGMSRKLAHVAGTFRGFHLLRLSPVSGSSPAYADTAVGGIRSRYEACKPWKKRTPRWQTDRPTDRVIK